MTIERLHELFIQFPDSCTDTRKITKNCIFFALKGEHFDGNKYASQALEKGASYAVIDAKKYAISDQYILVEDVLKTLQKLANYHRVLYKTRIIGLTGSNGKTTTKELIYSILSKKYRTIATTGNLNNHIGVPLTLLSIEQDTEIAVVEMGANHLEEIEFLCSLVQPDFGYITNFGKAHIEGFGSEKGVIKGKSELYDYILSNNRVIFLNADDPIQQEKLSTYVNKYGFSTNKDEHYKIEFLGANPFVKIRVEDTVIQSQLIGGYNFTNCSAAIMIGKYFNVALTDIKNAIENYAPQNNRSQIIERNGHQIIMDAYNANPTSMQAALMSFSTIGLKNKVAFLGDMFELGETTAVEHQNIVDLAAQLNFESVFLIGEHFYKTTTPLKKFKSFEAVTHYLKEHSLAPKKNILIKGSRGMALERILDVL